jgi:hypothetical protein
VEFRGFPELHAALLKESRTRGPVLSCVQEIRGISLVFREMWDTADPSLKPVAGPTEPHEWVAQLSLLRPGFLLEMGPGRNTQVSKARPGPPTQCSSVAGPNFIEDRSPLPASMQQ